MELIEIIVIIVSILIVGGVILSAVLRRRTAKKTGKFVSSCGCDCSKCGGNCQQKSDSSARDEQL